MIDSSLKTAHRTRHGYRFFLFAFYQELHFFYTVKLRKCIYNRVNSHPFGCRAARTVFNIPLESLRCRSHPLSQQTEFRVIRDRAPQIMGPRAAISSVSTASSFDTPAGISTSLFSPTRYMASNRKNTTLQSSFLLRWGGLHPAGRVSYRQEACRSDRPYPPLRS